MLANANMTVYEKDAYARHMITDVYWNDSRGRTVAKNGVQISDSVIVYLYSDEYVPKVGDIIVRDIVDFEIDSSSQKSISEGMKSFREKYPGFAVIKLFRGDRRRLILTDRPYSQ